MPYGHGLKCSNWMESELLAMSTRIEKYQRMILFESHMPICGQNYPRSNGSLYFYMFMMDKSTPLKILPNPWPFSSEYLKPILFITRMFKVCCKYLNSDLNTCVTSECSLQFKRPVKLNHDLIVKEDLWPNKAVMDIVGFKAHPIISLVCCN